MTLQKLLRDTLDLKQEIESMFAVQNLVKGEINYEDIRFIFRISPPIKSPALVSAQKYFKIQDDGSLVIEADGVAALAQVRSDLSKWIADLKRELEAKS